jgi:hypothetical protein
MRRLLLLVGLALAAHGCITPSIPIPPPDPSQMTFQLQGDVGNQSASFSYPPNVNYEHAVVFVFNRVKGIGVIETARSDGSVGPTAAVRADLGDEMVISFQREDQTVSTCIKLREGMQSSTDYCGP